MAIGIYILIFTGTEKVYIGQSKNLELRLSQHKSLFKTGSASQKMQAAFNAYGFPTMEVLIECEESELDSLEYETIALYNSVDNGFNTRKSAGGGANLWGDLNGRAKYSNAQITDAFLNTLLIFSSLLVCTFGRLFSNTLHRSL